MKIYTRTGDSGSTGLIGGRRVSKHDARIAALGDVDELNAVLGVAVAHGADSAELQRIQSALFSLGAEIGDPDARESVSITADEIAWLEERIDACDSRLSPLRQFILPGGSPVAAHLHHARTVCRRAERTLAALQTLDPTNPIASTYLNRLSDYLFVAARAANHDAGLPDHPWTPAR